MSDAEESKEKEEVEGESEEMECGEEEVVITLSETETISLLDIRGSVVSDPGQQETVQNSNLLYKEVRHVVSKDRGRRNTPPPASEEPSRK